MEFCLNHAWQSQEFCIYFGAQVKAGSIGDGVLKARHESFKSDGDLVFHAMKREHVMACMRSHDVLVEAPAEVIS